VILEIHVARALIISGSGAGRSRDDVFDEFPFDIREAIIAAAVAIGKALMVKPSWCSTVACRS
jgi:hypothetical protein